ncbi:hypothetical protein BKI52_42560 [marine bacterium AO1-C]|nr:hypothetical protein BKI52_42560 [marine bacterium AO1-C]
MKKITLIICLLMLFTIGSNYAQSAWIKGQGNGYFQVAFHSISGYNSLFNRDGDAIELARQINDRTAQLYGEFGLTKNLTLVANLPYKFLQAGSAQIATPIIEEGSLNTLGNVSLGLRHKIYSGGVSISGQVDVQANTSSYDDKTGLRSDLDAWSVTPTISLGKGSANSFFQVFAGYAWHSNDYSDHLTIGGEAGTKIFNKHWLIGFVNMYNSLENGNRTEEFNNVLTGLFLNNQEYVSFGFKGIFYFQRNFGLNIGMGGAFSGHLVAAAPALSLGFFYEIKD